MDPKFSTSFIPKKPVSYLVNSKSNTAYSSDTNIFSIMAGVIFTVTALTFGGLFLYKWYVGRQITEASQKIETARGQLELTQIQEIIDTNSRINASKNLLEHHVAMSKLLAELQNVVVRKVRVAELIYRKNGNDHELRMDIEALSYNAMAQQGILFNRSSIIKNPEFSNFRLGTNGTISSEFSSLLNVESIAYKNGLAPVVQNP